MGIRGLTTFINNRAHLYLKDYELHDCNVVIDGNSLASNLYKWHCKSNDYFGGDYDKLAHVIQDFFAVLSQCNITPYVILDGGYERRKLNTVLSRMKNKIYAAASLNPVSQSNNSVFPLFLREVFVDVVLNLGLKVARCEFEGDMQISAIAKTLDCPVISYDSDFYIFGCLYIPFTTVDLTPKKKKVKPPEKPYSFLSSKIYHIEEFLKVYGGLDRSNLPLLAVLLGNDYINGSLFNPFFKNLKIQKCSSSQSNQQKKIKSVIVWLQNENVESAIQKVLSRFKGPQRKHILKKIQSSMEGYNQANPELLKYLNIEPLQLTRSVEVDFGSFAISDDVDIVEDNAEEIEDGALSDCSVSISEIDDLNIEIEIDDEPENVLPAIFQNKYRMCQYPACFMDIVTLRKYYCVPQVEDNSLKDSHTISFEILKHIFKILCPNSTRGLSLAFRIGKKRIQFASLRGFTEELPSLKDIGSINEENRKLLLFKLLSIDNKFSVIFNSYPMQWHLFLISMKYIFDNNTGHFDNALLYACVLCFIILNFVDPKIGFYRVSKTFNKKFCQTLADIKPESLPLEFTTFDNLDKSNCLLFMDKMISFFQMDCKLKTNYRLFDRTLVHSLSQIQSVFLHVKYLNALLDNPFPTLEIHKIFDGTFIYNVVSNFRKRSNIIVYLEVFLKSCPSVLNAIKQTMNIVSSFINNTTTVNGPSKRTRKKKKKVVTESENPEDSGVIVSDDEGMFDPNNPYSLLALT
ncbi:protein asteroid-like [Euwallacea fornicatus]|uniref:protein asteroid-like n=1 Tax=Euwallacea fornicatus TaxID=995702 RepID=UPI00338DB3B1